MIELKTAQSDGETSPEGDDVFDEPEIVKLMVEYFYHFDYLGGADPVPVLATSFQGYAVAQMSVLNLQFPQPSVPPQVYIIEHAKVFAIAVKYQIDGLRDLAASKFKDAATAYWNHDDFAHSIHIAYNSTAEEVTQLRTVVTDILHQHSDDLEGKPEVEAIVCKIPRLAYALLRRSRAGGKHGGMGTEEQGHITAVSEVDDVHRCDQCGSRLIITSSGTSKLERRGKGYKSRWQCPYC